MQILRKILTIEISPVGYFPTSRLWAITNDSQLKCTFDSRTIIPLILSGCRAGQLSSVLRGFQLAAASEIENLRKVALEEAVKFDSIRIVEHLLVDKRPL